jgi:hypothetical protein
MNTMNQIDWGEIQRDQAEYLKRLKKRGKKLKRKRSGNSVVVIYGAKVS